MTGLLYDPIYESIFNDPEREALLGKLVMAFVRFKRRPELDQDRFYPIGNCKYQKLSGNMIKYMQHIIESYPKSVMFKNYTKDTLRRMAAKGIITCAKVNQSYYSASLSDTGLLFAQFCLVASRSMLAYPYRFYAVYHMVDSKAVDKILSDCKTLKRKHKADKDAI